VGHLRGGDPAAATALWERYFTLLVHVAKRRLARSHRSAEADEEDAALSAFVSFCSGAAGGRFPKLADREELWRLLVVITARKVGDQVDRRRSLKRGGHLARVDAPAECGYQAGFLEAQSREPDPEVATMVAEETERLLEQLGDESLRAIALWRMEGFTCDEIAAKLGCTRRTVARKLDMIRYAWSRELE
jgi:DNA-directed RNA polymerase specialized sigma24 family protein